MTMPKQHLGHYIGPTIDKMISENIQANADAIEVAKRLSQKENDRVNQTSGDHSIKSDE